MNYYKFFLIIHSLLFSFCVCELNVNDKSKLLNSFLNYYDSLPNQIYVSEKGSVQTIDQVDDTTYQIVVDLKVKELNNIDITKYFKCTARVQTSSQKSEEFDQINVVNNQCLEDTESPLSETVSEPKTTESHVEVTEPVIERKPVQLDNEVQGINAEVTSGEQFIAIPRDQPTAPCIGCASHVNPQAAGVSDLANLGLRHLDIHEPSVKHNLESVLDVKRQVQVVNGVRYILTLLINFNNCSEVDNESCATSKTCKITVLVKPWVKLPNGANYRAILGNNCTEEWLYGDNGEVIPELSPGSPVRQGDDIQVKHVSDVQSQSNQEKLLTDEELKSLQEQIIPNNQFQQHTDVDLELTTISPNAVGIDKQHVFKVDSIRHNDNSILPTESGKIEQQTTNINIEKKKAIDEMLDFFNFSGYKPKSENEKVTRIRRSYEDDLQVLSLAEDFKNLKRRIGNAKFVYKMAQAVVEYLNEMDLELKNRVLINVIKAEEEFENHQRFMYIQAKVEIPCKKVECVPQDTVYQICNGVIDSTNNDIPQILNAFCHSDNKERELTHVIDVPVDDPVLKTLAEEAVKKMESESNSEYAIKINKIVAANTQTTSGTLTKISMIIDNINCNKSVPLTLRLNCAVLEQLGSKLCEVIIHEKHWLKERKILYTCIYRPVDMKISKSKSIYKNVSINDPKVNEMLQEAIQYLETQSNRNNKQKIVSVKSVASQIIAGFLTKVEFVVGYTNCTVESHPTDTCELLKHEDLRTCKAQIWDRSWIVDGRQVEVSCDEVGHVNENDKIKKKRSVGMKRSGNHAKPDYDKLANECLKRFLRSSASRQHYKVVKVEQINVREDNGKLTRIDFTITPTNCLLQGDGLLSLTKCDIVNPKNISRCHSKILEQVYLDKVQYFVNCNINDGKLQTNIALDGIKEQDTRDLKYYQLAEESLNKYLHDIDNTTYHRIVRVEKVTTQTVSGLLTSIDFIISPKNDSNTSDEISCRSKILEKRWLGTKVFNVSCQIEQNNNIEDSEYDPDNPKYMQIAVEALQKYIKKNPDSHLIRVTFVDKVIRKEGGISEIYFVASGAEDDDGDTICHAVFSVKGEDIEMKCHLLGGISRKTEITEDDPNFFEYIQLADESIHQYQQSLNNSLIYTTANIEKVTVQWDEGIKTEINFIAIPIDMDSNQMQGKRCISQIREQPWLHKRQIYVNCEVDKDLYRTKRDVHNIRVKRRLGGNTEQDTTDPKYKKLAEESLRKYVKDSEITQDLKVHRIDKVTTQIVSGLLTKIDFLVSDNQDVEIMTCHSKIWERSWLNKKDIELTCQNVTKRLKRESRLYGGLMEQDPNDPEYKLLAEESWLKYVQQSGLKSHAHKVERVNKVTTEVVSGKLTRIDFMVSNKQGEGAINCHSQILEQPWLNKRNIDVTCQKANERLKMSIGKLGGITDQDPTEPKYKVLAEESLRKYIKNTGSSQFLEVVRVEKVTTQIVAGLMTRIDFVASEKQGSDTIKCHSEIVELNNKNINVACQKVNERIKKGKVGGITDQDTTEPKYKMLAEESLRKYVQNTGSSQSLKVVHIEKVTTQIVAGLITRIDFVALEKRYSNTIKCHSEIVELYNRNFHVTCQKVNESEKRHVGMPGGLVGQDPNDPHYKLLAEESWLKYVQQSGLDLQTHKVERVDKVTTQVVAGIITRIDFMVSSKHGDGAINCHSEIYEQSWLNNRNVNVTCQKVNERVKRGIGMPGGITTQDPTEPKYKVLAEESLRKYIKNTGSSQFLEVVRVEKVTTQIVAGLMTHIDFVASEKQGTDTIKCHSEIVELNNKNINVTCQEVNERVKRHVGMAGGLLEQNPNDPEYKLLAEESWLKYVQQSGLTSQTHKVERVDKVTTQIVAGIITRIDFMVSNEQGDGAFNCHSVILEQSWLNNRNVNVTCQKVNERVKRGIGMPGGIMDQDPTEPKYKVLAEESLRKYVQNTGSSQFLEVVRVEKVTTQIVAGLMTRIDFVASEKQGTGTIKCHSEIVELNNKNINVTCQEVNERVKRHVGMAGGLLEQNPNDPEYKLLAEESWLKYVQQSGLTSQTHKVERVDKVTTQIVAGIITRIDFMVSNEQGDGAFNCHSVILEQSWLNNRNVNVTCQKVNERVKRGIGMPGGIMDQDPTEPKYKVLAEESLRKYVQNTGSSQFLEVVRVEKVTTQIVAGLMTRIDFVASEKQGTGTIKCHSEIVELNNKNINVTCQEVNERVKRHVGMPGGLLEQNPNDPKYKLLAEESWLKYVQQSGLASQTHKVERVDKVTTQVVAGIITRIDFMVSNEQGDGAFNCHSVILEQSWLNNRNVNVTCQKVNERVKRGIGMPGGITTQDPTEPKYKVLAEESLRKYIKNTGSSQSLEVVHIEKVATQIVAGLMTRIDFVASEKQGTGTIKCHSEIVELNNKNINVTCQEVNERVKRHVGMPGGLLEQNPNDPKYKLLAEESWLKYVQQSGLASQTHKVERVDKVTTQVVAGIITRIDFMVSNEQGDGAFNCHSVILEQSWLNNRNVNVTCQKVNERVKRGIGMPGGITTQDPTEPKYKVLAEESLRKYIKNTGSSQFLEVVRVEKVTTQIVAGLMTHIDFVASEKQGTDTIKCHSEIVELNNKNINVTCQEVNERVKRHVGMAGGLLEQNPNDPEYKLLAEESWLKYVQQSGLTSQTHKVERVDKVTTQIVAGIITRIDFMVSNEQGDGAFNCHSVILEQSWLNNRNVNVTCQKVNERVKRGIGMPGGIMDQDPTEPKYKVLAEESLRKYIKNTGSSQSLEVVHIEKVATQIVAGLMTRIDFIASETQGINTIKCHSEIVELNNKNINVNCQDVNQRMKREIDSYNRKTELISGIITNNMVMPHDLRGQIEEVQDPNKTEYKLLAEESLRKYQQKSNIYHKVVEVKRVVIRVVSGFKYNIDFIAVPTVCFANVSSARARSCEPVDDIVLYCNTDIWDRPWLKQKKIDIQCQADDEDSEDYVSDSDTDDKDFETFVNDESLILDENYKLAEESMEKYLTRSKRKYVHKVTELHNSSKHIADGTIIKLEFSISPTNCLRNKTRGSKVACEIKQPLVVLHCNAKIWERPLWHIEKDIEVNCKKINRHKKHKRDVGEREIGFEDDEIDEDITYYYADRAVHHINDRSSSNNLHKLISIHGVQNSYQMNTLMVRMYIEVAETFCLRHHREEKLDDCEELDGLNHRLCLARLWPSPDDELVVRHVSVVCDDEEDFVSATNLNIPELLRMSIENLERSPDNAFKLVHQGEPQVIPSLDSKVPIKLNFIIATTNCSKNVDLQKNPFQCFIDTKIPSKACHSFIWLNAETKIIRYINTKCKPPMRSRRSLLGSGNVTSDMLEIQKLVMASLEKLEMASLHRYKQRVLQINSYSTKITTGKVTTIDFDVGYTSCLKYEWVENITSCDFLEHLPRRRCVAQIWERLWINNGRNIDVNCVDDETPLESHIEFESAEMANQLAKEALKHIEAKYPHPKKQKIVRIFSLEKQVVAGIHYRMKVEVGFTDCVALSEQTDCKLDKDIGINKFCRVNVWVRPWTDHPPNFRVSCDFQEGATHNLYHHIQAEHLFYNFLTMYNPSYVNDYSQMQKRFEIFKSNIKKIHEFNVHEKGTAVYGVTRFTDLTYEEFSSKYMGLNTSLRNENQIPMKIADIPDIKVPDGFDWREYDAVTDVKDQGSCGSCWAFSVTGNIEGQWKMQSGQLVSLSEQELVDCDKLDNGCNGGLPDNAYRSIEQLGGLELESDYPYEGDDEKCEFNKTLAKVQISGAVNITSNETGMAQWLVQNGPISIGINANAMQFYMGGISHPWKMLCNPTNLDHGVLIVGYGVKDYPLFHKKLPYWIIKNSWGKSWGEQGYYRVYRGDGTCGVNQMASSAVI